jgi:hypothetical protein
MEEKDKKPTLLLCKLDSELLGISEYNIHVLVKGKECTDDCAVALDGDLHPVI